MGEVVVLMSDLLGCIQCKGAIRRRRDGNRLDLYVGYTSSTGAVPIRCLPLELSAAVICDITAEEAWSMEYGAWSMDIVGMGEGTFHMPCVLYR